MGYVNATSLPRLDRLVLVLFALGSALIYAGYAGYTATRPVYPPGSLPPDARGGGAGSCRMTFMSPSYFHLPGFNKSHTRLGNGPWGLYLYREAGWDDDPVHVDDDGSENLILSGTPVLFVPGNAGSFKQVRSLASVATRTFWELPGVPRQDRGGGGRSNLDFFTLDFNDDFSAFHGQTLFDQSEYTADAIRYILSIYSRHGSMTGPTPTSVIVVAHSMGGIVARAAFLDPRYQPDSISTLVTFATPHLLPPVTVDSGVDRFYSSTNSFWRDAYKVSGEAATPPSTTNPLRDVVTVSIGGGISDEMIASETTLLDSLVPTDGTNGFAVSTTAIPGVQTPVDHLAILWCNQLMQVVAESILAIVDARNPNKVVSRAARIDEFSTRLLGRLEHELQAVRVDGDTLLSTIERGEPAHRLEPGERLTVQPGAFGGQRRTFVLPVAENPNRRRFSLLTSASIAKQDAVEVYGCTRSRDLSQATETTCTSLSPDFLTVLPASPHSAVSPILPASTGDDEMNLVFLEDSTLQRFEAIAVVVEAHSTAWVVAEVAGEGERVQISDRKARHYKIAIPSEPWEYSMMHEVWLDGLDTSLLAFKLTASRSDCQERKSLFAPLLRQYSSTSHESKYFPNVRTASLYTHSTGPYLSPRPAGVRLQFFVDSTCTDEPGHGLYLEISIDLLRTAGNLFLRYRMALVTIPFALIVLVFAVQINEFRSESSFPPFDAALAVFARRYLPALLFLLVCLGYAQTLVLGGRQSSLSPGGTSRWIRDAFLGTSDGFWVPLFPVLVVASFAILIVEYIGLSMLVNIVAWMAHRLARKSSLAKSAISSSGPDAKHLTPLQRLTALALLVVLTLFFAPYQFAFLVLFLVHLLTTIRILVSMETDTAYVPIDQHDSTAGASTRAASSPAREATAQPLPPRWDAYHLSFSVLFLLLSLVPSNALVLVVWVRNLAVGSFAPFSSDRQPWSILGFLALVESIHSRTLVPDRPSSPPSTTLNRTSLAVTLCVAIGSAAYSLLYGIRSAHGIYAWANVLAGSLAWATGGRELVVASCSFLLFRRQRRDDDVVEPARAGQDGMMTGRGSPQVSRRKASTTTLARTQD
ncbi:hypothetical protein JCM11491_003846 [Sporobolomyces phaffii]